MLVQALGTNNFAAVLTSDQMLVFTVFSLFYVPCLATLGMLRSVLGTRSMFFVLFFTTVIGIIIALLFRLGLALF
jgi:ferrous iron transport protein B